MKAEKEKAQEGQLTPRQEALLYGRRLPVDIEEDVMSAVKSGLNDAECAAAGGLTLGELRYVFYLAEQGHAGYREFRDAYFRYRNSMVGAIKAAQFARAKSEDGSIADRRYALSLIDKEAYPEHEEAPQGKERGIMAGGFTFQVVTQFERPALPTDVDAEDAEVVE